MDVKALYITAAASLLVILLYRMRHRRHVKKILKHNDEAPPLLLQRSTQLKITRLQEATQNNVNAAKQLERLTESYKNKKIGIHEYNDKLDSLIIRLNVEL